MSQRHSLQPKPCAGNVSVRRCEQFARQMVAPQMVRPQNLGLAESAVPSVVPSELKWAIVRKLRWHMRPSEQARNQFVKLAVVVFISAPLSACSTPAPVSGPTKDLNSAASITATLAPTSLADVPVSSVAPNPNTDPERNPNETDTTPINGVAVGAKGGDRFPDVIGAKLVRSDLSTFEVFVTISSPYDTPQRYTDAWRVLDSDGNELGVRELTHDHQTEQPFERSLAGVVIDGPTFVVIEGRDQRNGWGGQRWQIPVPPKSVPVR
jgi:hypothetical protein